MGNNSERITELRDALASTDARRSSIARARLRVLLERELGASYGEIAKKLRCSRTNAYTIYRTYSELPIADILQRRTDIGKIKPRARHRLHIITAYVSADEHAAIMRAIRSGRASNMSHLIRAAVAEFCARTMED